MNEDFLRHDFLILREVVRQCRAVLADYLDPGGISAETCFDELRKILFDPALAGAFDPRLELQLRPEDDFLLQDFAVLHRSVKRARIVLLRRYERDSGASDRRCMDWLLHALDNEYLGAAGNFGQLSVLEARPGDGF